MNTQDAPVHTVFRPAQAWWTVLEFGAGDAPPPSPPVSPAPRAHLP